MLYYLDQRSAKYKKYRIPAHENPYFTSRDNEEAKNQYGGEDSEDYQHLILGRHGDPTFTMIPRDKIKTEPFEFYSYRYNQSDKQNGRHYRDLMQLHKIPEHLRVHTMLSVDCGYADPTLAHIMARDEVGIWRTFARFRLTRIPFPEQSEFIDWLDNFFNFNLISVDLGAGGGGIGIMQDLTGDRFSKGKQYAKRVTGVRFGDFIDRGDDPSGNVLKINSKSFGGQELARMITESELIFSELDFEGMSQVERVAYQRMSDGTNRYFVMSETGRGKSQDDHIFASFVVFILTIVNTVFARRQKKLFSAAWIR